MLYIVKSFKLEYWKTSDRNEAHKQFWRTYQCVDDYQLSTCPSTMKSVFIPLIQCVCFSSLVPPSCSISLVSDWFNQLTAVNEQIGKCLNLFDVCLKPVPCFWGTNISKYMKLKQTWNALTVCLTVCSDSFHADFLDELRGCYEQMRQDRSSEMERCKVKTQRSNMS